VGETLLRAYKGLDQFRGKTEAEFRGWLRTILKNVLLGWLAPNRPLQKTLEESSLRLEKFLADGRSTPSQRLMREEQLACLAEAVAALPEDQRQAVQLRHLDGLSLAEVGRQMGRTKEAVAGLLFRALRKLRDALQDPTSRPQEEKP
jgi:RNA polymerase sigma-70 factor (ECF subfamily)